MTQTPWTDEQVQYVERIRFPMQRGGFVPEDVDRQLHRIVTLMRAEQAVPQVAPTAMRRTRLRQAYAPAPVEKLFDQIMIWQREVQAAGPAQDPAPEPAPAAPQAGTAAAPRHTEETLRWTRQQQDWVRESTFGKRGGSNAYVMDEVDDFLDRVLVAMAKGEPLPPIESVKFYPPRFAQSGYDAIEVDEFLDQLMTLRPALPEG